MPRTAAMTANDLYRGGIQYIDVGGRHDQFVAMLSVITEDLPAGVASELTALAFDTPTYTLADVALERRRETRDAKAAAAAAVYNDYVADLDAAWQAGTDMDAVGTLGVNV